MLAFIRLIIDSVLGLQSNPRNPEGANSRTGRGFSLHTVTVIVSDLRSK